MSYQGGIVCGDEEDGVGEVVFNRINMDIRNIHSLIKWTTNIILNEFKTRDINPEEWCHAKGGR